MNRSPSSGGNRNALLKMLLALAAIVAVSASLSKLLGGDSRTLSEYFSEEAASTETSASGAAGDPSAGNASMEAAEASAPPSGYPAELTGSAAGEDQEPASSYPETGAEPGSPSYPETDAEPGSPTEARPVLAGHALNGSSVEEARISYTADFYYEPLSASLRRYIRAVSYPADETEAAVSYGDLRYVHVLHYDFEGKVAEGELICHEKIAQDLAEIFYELYRNEYRIEKIRLIDEYDGDDRASMEDNNTSCFNHRTVENSSNLSRHAYGLAVDVNPFYNPYVVYQTDGNARISPASAAAYADRSGSFPYKIDESDLCYRLFTEHGFTWGGSWNSSKDYQHFQKAP